MAVWNALLKLVENALVAIHGSLEGMLGVAAWGWAIIALTLVMRVLLLPLAIKQTRSMKAMQELQPQIKKIQAKYKADRGMAKKDPDKYKELRQKASEETMALYKEHNVNPASGCLPLLLQAPIFFALFRVLRDLPELKNASFYFITDHISPSTTGLPEGSSPAEGLGAALSTSGWPGFLLIALMVGTMFYTQKQMMSRTTNASEQVMQQQKIMLYVMPLFLGFISWTLPLGVMLYWITTNLWQMAQQYIIFREVQHDADAHDAAAIGTTGKGAAKGAKTSKPAQGKKPVNKPSTSAPKSGTKPGSGGNKTSNGSNGSKTSQGRNGSGNSKGSTSGGTKKGRSGRSDHLPASRRQGGNR